MTATETRPIRVRERLALMGPNLYAHTPCMKWTIDLGRGHKAARRDSLR